MSESVEPEELMVKGRASRPDKLLCLHGDRLILGGTGDSRPRPAVESRV